MATSLAPTHVRNASVLLPATSDLTMVMSKVAAVLAAAGGVVHLAVIRHHLDYGLISAGFALMGVAQLLVAVGLFTRPRAQVRVAGVVVHAAIAATWLLSRTVGLLVVRGAEEPVSFGLPDSIANLFGAGVITSLVVIELVHRRSARVTLSAHTGRRVIALLALGALGLTASAISVPHAHAGHDHPPPSESGHDEAPTVDAHGEDHAHTHG